MIKLGGARIAAEQDINRMDVSMWVGLHNVLYFYHHHNEFPQ